MLKSGVDRQWEAIEAEIIQGVRADIGAVASFKKALLVKRLPKTRSGKVLRRALRDLADGRDYAIPSTIDDPEILGEIEQALQASRSS